MLLPKSRGCQTGCHILQSGNVLLTMVHARHGGAGGQAYERIQRVAALRVPPVPGSGRIARLHALEDQPRRVQRQLQQLVQVPAVKESLDVLEGENQVSAWCVSGNHLEHLRVASRQYTLGHTQHPCKVTSPSSSLRFAGAVERVCEDNKMLYHHAASLMNLQGYVTARSEAMWQPACATPAPGGAHVAKMPRALTRARCSSSAAASAVPARASVPLPSSSTSTSASGPASSSTYLAKSVLGLGRELKVLLCLDRGV